MQQFRLGGFSILPPVIKNLLIINVLFFLAEEGLKKAFGIDIVDLLGLHYVEASKFQIYQFVTYLFLHGGFSHLFFNMFALWMFGATLENIWGAKKFLIFYMITGIGAGITNQVVNYFEVQNTLAQFPYAPTAEIQQFLNTFNTIGASGAVFGLLMAFGMMFPNNLIYLYFAIPVKAKWFVIGYGLIELFSGITNSSSNIAHFAHLGGMIFGFFILIYWKKKGKLFTSN
ncbi:MAG: rhomboid family intramembrane serine protease [Bacteroidales bacterium]